MARLKGRKNLVTEPRFDSRPFDSQSTVAAAECILPTSPEVGKCFGFASPARQLRDAAQRFAKYVCLSNRSITGCHLSGGILPTFTPADAARFNSDAAEANGMK